MLRYNPVWVRHGKPEQAAGNVPGGVVRYVAHGRNESGSDGFSSFAEKLRGDAQVGSYLRIGQARSPIGVFVQESQAPFLSGRADRLQQPILQLNLS